MTDLTKENIENLLSVNNISTSELAYLAEYVSTDESTVATLAEIILDILEMECE